MTLSLPPRVAPLIVGLACLVPTILVAQETAEGSELAVNTATTGDQNSSDVSVDDDGSFVVVWEDENDTSIQLRRYSSDGTPLAGQQAADSLGGDSTSPAVAHQNGGGFVAAWVNTANIQVRRFLPNGTGNGPEFSANSITTGYRADIGAADDGSFVVVWEAFGDDIQARRFSSVGNPIGAEFDVDAMGGIAPALAVEPDGDFVVAWHDNPAAGGAYDVFARRFGSDGTPFTDVLEVNTYTPSAQRWAAVGVDADGDFVVVWNNTSGYDVRGQLFASDGTPDGGELILIDTTHGGAFDGPSAAAMRDDGSFVVAWETDYGSGELFERQFDASGTPLAAGTMVNTSTAGSGNEASIGPGPNGSFVVTWTNRYAFSDGGGGDADDSDRVRAQRFGSAEPPLFADGFESGDTTAWGS